MNNEGSQLNNYSHILTMLKKRTKWINFKKEQKYFEFIRARLRIQYAAGAGRLRSVFVSFKLPKHYLLACINNTVNFKELI